VSWTEQVFNYCERGLDPTFWAEPINALSNGAFLVAAAFGAAALARHAGNSEHPSTAERLAIWLLIAVVAIIGIGSFAFHTFATRWALIADVAPITVFMIAYLVYALRMFLQLGWLTVALAVAAFLYVGSLASSLTCAGHQVVSGTAQGEPCFNGSLGYAPALATLFIVGGIAARRGLSAGRTLLAAGGIFFVSAIFRTVDRDVCGMTAWFGQVRGTHALWHLLNALTLYMLLIAAIHRDRGEPINVRSRPKDERRERSHP
jgi:hypothetical protein